MRRIVTLVAAFTVAGGALVATAAEASASFVAYETGYGSTLQSAEFAAREQFASDYYGCGTPSLVSSSQQSDGSWSATMVANCRGYV